MQIYLIVNASDGVNVDVKSSLHRAESSAYSLNQLSGDKFLVQKCIVKLNSAHAQKYLLTRELTFFLTVLYNGVSFVTCAAFSSQNQAFDYIEKNPASGAHWIIEEWDFKKDMNEDDKKELGLME